MNAVMSIAASAVPAVFELVKSLMPTLATTTSAGVIGSTIKVLAEYTPLVLSSYKALKPVVEDAITMLRANENTMPEQLEHLREMARQYDLEWADALALSRAGDKAAGYADGQN